MCFQYISIAILCLSKGPCGLKHIFEIYRLDFLCRLLQVRHPGAVQSDSCNAGPASILHLKAAEVTVSGTNFRIGFGCRRVDLSFLLCTERHLYR